VHVPDVHCMLPVHAWPQEPQFAASVRVLMHMPPHIISPVPHPLIEHVPALHTAPPVHALPHVPQFALSVSRFTHALPHMI